MGLDTVEFILWSEREFEIDIPDSDAQNIFTVGQFSTYVRCKLLVIHGSNTTSKTEIFERIKNFLVSEYKIASEKLTTAAIL